LNVDVLCYTSWNHAFFRVPDLKLRCLGRKNMQPLWCWTNIYHAYLQSVGFVCFEATKLNYCWWSLKYTIWTNRVKCIVLGNRIGPVLFPTSK
jgi:hypothetical protein